MSRLTFYIVQFRKKGQHLRVVKRRAALSSTVFPIATVRIQSTPFNQVEKMTCLLRIRATINNMVSRAARTRILFLIASVEWLRAGNNQHVLFTSTLSMQQVCKLYTFRHCDVTLRHEPDSHVQECVWNTPSC